MSAASDPEVFVPLDAQLRASDAKNRVPQLHVAGEAGAIGLAEA